MTLKMMSMTLLKCQQEQFCHAKILVITYGYYRQYANLHTFIKDFLEQVWMDIYLFGFSEANCQPTILFPWDLKLI